MFIYGASGHAKVIIDSLVSRNVPIEGLFDDNPQVKSLKEFKVLGSFSNHKEAFEGQLILAIGDNKIREKIASTLKVEYSNAIHTSTIISSSVKMATGIAIMSGVVVNADTILGMHVILNTMSSVDHDCVIGDFVHVGPKATICGNVQIGKGTLIGAGSTIAPNLTIGKDCVIGAGAVITKNIPDHSRVIKFNQII